MLEKAFLNRNNYLSAVTEDSGRVIADSKSGSLEQLLASQAADSRAKS